MRMTSFLWFTAAIVLILVIVLAFDHGGGDLMDWMARLHGQ